MGEWSPSHWVKSRFGITWWSWIAPSLWDLMRYIPESWGDWLTFLPKQSLWKVKAVRQTPWWLKKGKITPVFKRRRKEDVRNHRSVSLPSVPGKIMKQILPEVILQYIKDNKLTEGSQHSFTKGKLYLKTRGIIYLDFCRPWYHLTCHPHLQIGETWVWTLQQIWKWLGEQSKKAVV